MFVPSGYVLIREELDRVGRELFPTRNTRHAAAWSVKMSGWGSRICPSTRRSRAPSYRFLALYSSW